MPYVVTEDCIKCKYMDCVETCPVSCFYEGQNMLVIHPDECIDCAACEPTCPIEAIVSDDTAAGAKWAELNRKYSAFWPRIVEKGAVPEDAKQWEKTPNKFATHFSAQAGASHVAYSQPGRSDRSKSQDTARDGDSDFA
ncbi:MAG: ferredoxin family protein [Betaproteobacteria bacterium]|nr:ferredoxin family protein [Betaproteobacteria bacterium]